ncbi:hypothetical protein [Brevibacterium jeotgali]|uniref:Uncharacterized protein n=1 Tax=Brevibacterium jeotgali TaxID=1262550 RepID=A0A2H1L695_9MICO|nr:hypothetical protein [Brevibacterium jeotgali]TWC03593.1 hypothetical protein FB108_2325 [Brevibacterium jeotgali]SMY12416.1 hypothetical protein BJEO58_02010 [Brevibacterium jeotgali]
MSPADAHGRELLTEESERALARQAAVAALTAVGRMRAEAEAEAEAGAGGGSGSGGGPGSGSGFASTQGVTGAGGSGGATGVGPSSGRADGGRVGRRVGFASPERAVRRRLRGGWAARG